MGKRIVVNAGVTETRLAVQDGNLLTELYIERADRRSIVGNIYKGVVTRVLPGMQSSFVDCGLERDAFLYVADVLEELPENLLTPEEQKSAAKGGHSIEDLVKEGQEVLVQVLKEPLGTKGARITAHV